MILAAQGVYEISGEGGSLEIVVDVDGTLAFVGDWTPETLIIEDDRLTRLLTLDNASVRVNNRNYWSNPIERFDVNRSGEATVADALNVINYLRRQGIGRLTLANVDPTELPYANVSGDSQATVVNALEIITKLVRLNASEVNRCRWRMDSISHQTVSKTTKIDARRSTS